MDLIQVMGLTISILAGRCVSATAESLMRKTTRCGSRGLVADNMPSLRSGTSVDTMSSLRTGTGVDLSVVPDYVEPVVGYRVWLWDKQRITSINGAQWKPGVALEAICPKTRLHPVPDSGCTCGVYAGIDIQHLLNIRYLNNCVHSIHGEVYLWGRSQRCTLGWRAQYAYPKSFVIPPYMAPVGIEPTEAKRRFETLVAFNVDIYLQKDWEPSVDGEKVPLWTKERGWWPEALRFLQEFTLTSQ